jgi:hypothetical protein
MKFNCSSMFEVNKHIFDNYIFSIILADYTKVFYFFPEHRFLHKTLSQLRQNPATMIWVAT